MPKPPMKYAEPLMPPKRSKIAAIHHGLRTISAGVEADARSLPEHTAAKEMVSGINQFVR
jgi:hypothetical protein